MYSLTVKNHLVLCSSTDALLSLLNALGGPVAAVETNGHIGAHDAVLPIRRPRRATGGTKSGVSRSWAKANRVAKKLGRTDIKAVRSEIAAGKL